MTQTMSTPRVLIDASNLHSGGGVQVAASFLDELADISESAEMTTAYPWLPSTDVELSSAVERNVEPATVAALTGSVIDRRPRHIGQRRSRGYDVSFVVFGPEYGLSRATARIVGFADSTILHARPSGVARPPIRRGATNWLRALVSRRLLRTADVLVVETDRTALDIGKRLGLAPDRVRVVSNTVNAIFDNPAGWGPSLPRPDVPDRAHLLAYVSRGYPHKNFDLLGNVGEIARSRFGLEVVFLLTLNDQEWNGLTPQTRRHSINLGPVPVVQVPEIYRMADAAIFPSLLESFSAMPLEAMKMGRVVFASDRGFVRTSCGAGPVYIEPLDPVSAATTLARSLPDQALMRRHEKCGTAVVAGLPTARDRALAFLNIVDEMLIRQVASPSGLQEGWWS